MPQRMQKFDCLEAIVHIIDMESKEQIILAI